MSEPRDAPGDAHGRPAGPVDSEPTGAPPAATPAAGSIVFYRTVAGAALLVAALLLTANYWTPLLPWNAGAGRDDAALAGRIERLANAQLDARRQGEQAAATVDAAVQRLDRRIGALEARPTTPVADIAEIRELQARLSTAMADLTTRVAALDKAVHTGAAAEATDTALVLVLLQIRDAVAAGRPFEAEYQAFVALAGARPEIAAAAAPLTEPAKTGVASRAVLEKGLRELRATVAAGTTAAGTAPSGDGGWGAAALARLRGLVTIRRIDTAGGDSSPGAAVNAAERAFAGGDLAGAVDMLDKLTGAPAEAARPWLHMAKARLAVETAVQRIETLASSRLGAAAASAAPR